MSAVNAYAPIRFNRRPISGRSITSTSEDLDLRDAQEAGVSTPSQRQPISVRPVSEQEKQSALADLQRANGLQPGQQLTENQRFAMDRIESDQAKQRRAAVDAYNQRPEVQDAALRRDAAIRARMPISNRQALESMQAQRQQQQQLQEQNAQERARIQTPADVARIQGETARSVARDQTDAARYGADREAEWRKQGFATEAEWRKHASDTALQGTMDANQKGLQSTIEQGKTARDVAQTQGQTATGVAQIDAEAKAAQGQRMSDEAEKKRQFEAQNERTKAVSSILSDTLKGSGMTMKPEDFDGLVQKVMKAVGSSSSAQGGTTFQMPAASATRTSTPTSTASKSIPTISGQQDLPGAVGTRKDPQTGRRVAVDAQGRILAYIE